MTVVFAPQYPLASFSELVSGMVIFASSVLVARKVYFGSKNKFSYVLMLLSALYGICYIALALVDALRTEYILPSGQVEYKLNFTATILFYYYFFYLAAL